MTDHLPKFLISLLLFTSIAFLPVRVFGQLYPERQTQFLELVAESERPRAIEVLRELVERDSNSIFRLAEAAEAIILPGQSRSIAPNADEIALLQTVYALSSRHDPGGPDTWYLRQAMLVLRYPDVYRDRSRMIVQRAVMTNPFDCPLLLYEKWIEYEIADYEAKRIRVGELAMDWHRASELLQSRLIRHADPNEPAGRLQLNLLLRLRRVVSPCDDLLRTISNDPVATSCSAFLVLYALQDCYTEHELWEKEFNCARELEEEAWMYRLAAADALNRQDFAKASAFLARAIEMGDDPALQANDCLDLADILGISGQYRAARTRIKQAMDFMPSWGYPHIRLAELYLEGIKECDLPPFDKKAVYWLAIDLCQDAKNVDPSITLDANRRIYQYRLNTPSSKEVAFKGLSDGDTWPLKCWMSTVTTVKTK